jgi:hypothetical protein
MKTLFALMILVVALAGPGAIAQEHKHDEQKGENKAPTQKGTDAEKADSKKCCEGMEKTGEIKEGTPTKGDMKAKTEKMKEMKEKMTEKGKGMEGMKMKDM